MRGQACLQVMRHKVALLRLLRAGRDFDTLHLCARLGMWCFLRDDLWSTDSFGGGVRSTGRKRGSMSTMMCAFCPGRKSKVDESRSRAVMSGVLYSYAMCDAGGGAPEDVSCYL